MSVEITVGAFLKSKEDEIQECINRVMADLATDGVLLESVTVQISNGLVTPHQVDSVKLGICWRSLSHEK